MLLLLRFFDTSLPLFLYAIDTLMPPCRYHALLMLPAAVTIAYNSMRRHRRTIFDYYFSFHCHCRRYVLRAFVSC